MEDSGRNPTILIVEDIDWIRSGMRKAVEYQGYSVAEATNDEEAIVCAELESIELILTEEEVPAFEALMARLPNHPTLRSLRVAIVNPDAEAGARYGDAYILTDYVDISSFLVTHR